MQTCDVQRVRLENEEENRVALNVQAASKKQNKIKFMKIYENQDGSTHH